MEDVVTWRMLLRGGCWVRGNLVIKISDVQSRHLFSNNVVAVRNLGLFVSLQDASVYSVVYVRVLYVDNGVDLYVNEYSSRSD